MVKNGLQAIALNQRLALSSALWTQRGLAQLRGLALPPHTARRRDDSLELLAWINVRVDQLDAQLAAVVDADPRARRLLTHPGVGPLTALTTVLVLGPVTRFPDGKHVASYVGLAPAINASADKQHLGKITKQGNALLRWVLGQAAPQAARADDELRRRYFAILHRRGRPKAKVALARKLLVRLYVMLRDQIDYEEFRRRPRGSGIAGARHRHLARTIAKRLPQADGPVRAFSGSSMVCHDRAIEWDAHPRRSAVAIVDDRILTSCAAVRARMDGWWTFARGSTTLHACLSTRRDKSNDAVTLDTNDRSHGSMTSSARSRNDCGIVRPRALAVLRLITISNLVACSTGRSAGLAPFRILSTWVAAWRSKSARSGP